MANYINTFTDIGFKRIFGQEFSKPLLIDFLNNLLIGEKRIVDRLYLRISHLFRQLGKYFSPIWEINCPKLAYLTRFLFSQSGMEIP